MEVSVNGRRQLSVVIITKRRLLPSIFAAYDPTHELCEKRGANSDCAQAPMYEQEEA
jgi:hypothetical protein